MAEAFDLKGQDGIQAFTDLPDGTKITLTNGAVGNVVANPRDGAFIQVKFTEHPNGSLVGEEVFVFFNEVASAVSE